jgi:hypothetical protein
MVRAGSFWLGWFALLAACSSERPGDGGVSLDAAPRDAGDAAARADADPEPPVGCRDGGCLGSIDLDGGVTDLLFVVDDSNSMGEEQLALRREFPRLIEKLVSGDHDRDGKPDHATADDLHIGVVSSNLGGHGRTIGCMGDGDDGLLLSIGNRARDSSLECAGGYPTFLSYRDGSPELPKLASDFGCIAALGTAGCGFEQHLESALKALWPADDLRLTFMANFQAEVTTGHGNRANAGFVRTLARGYAASLVVVVVADEDDCSTSEPAIFSQEPVDAGNPFGATPVNLRCHDYADRLLPLERYLFGYRNLGSARVVFAGIVGVPVDLVDTAARAKVDFADARARDAYYDGLLADPRMQERPDLESDVGSGPRQLEEACKSTLGRAAPARRFVTLAKRFGANALIQSICGDSFGPPLDRVVETIVGPD